MDLGDFQKFRIAPDEAISPSTRHCNPFAQGEDTTELLQLALEGAGVGVWDMDVVTNVVRLCPQGLLILGFPDDHSNVVTHEEWQKLIDIGDAEQIQQWVNAQSFSPLPRLREYRIRRPDGEIRWLRTSARAVPDRTGCAARLIGVLFDDTERKRAEEEVRQNDERLHLIQEAALIGTFSATTDLKTVGSRQFYRNLGLPDDTISIVDHEVFALIHPADRERVKRESLAIVESDVDHQDIEYRINRADTGEVRWIFPVSSMGARMMGG